MLAVVVLAVVLLLQQPRAPLAFNADVPHAVAFLAASEDRLFGYSVTLASGQLLVGEPQGSWPTRGDLHKPGGLYRCGAEQPPPMRPGGQAWGQAGAVPRCSSTVLEGREDAYIGGYLVKHVKNDSMFASTVVALSARITLVCGPGWKDHLYQNDHYLMNGLCYALSDRPARSFPYPYAPLAGEHRFQAATVADPARGPNATKRVFNYAFGEAGFSAHFSQDAQEVLLGAPGVLQSRGSAIRYRVTPEGQLVEKVVTSTDTLEESSYFGYSVASGRFQHRHGGRVQYVAGAPRAAHTGKVLLFELDDAAMGRMRPLHEEYGDQLGEYFGAAVLAEDVDGDGLADLLVGAPLHTTSERGDEGRVYVFLNGGGGRLKRAEPPLTPRRAPQYHDDLQDQQDHADHGARFGSAIAAAGDVNKDGFNDVWVGAPFEDGGLGAVYLFLGSRSGLRTTAAQRIAAKDIRSDLHSFGFSLSAGVDLDGNGYPDLAVGAPLSGAAVVLLSKPAARLVARITPSTAELALTATSVVLTACLEYTGPGAAHRADAAVSLLLDGPWGQLDRGWFQVATRQPSRQVHYLQPVTLDRWSCTDVAVAIRPGRPDSDDFSIPIDVTMKFNLTDDVASRDRPFCRACPALDPTAPTSVSLKIPFATGCANNTVCRPDLRVAVQWQGASLPLVLGSSRQVTLRVVVTNAGETAFLAKVSMKLAAPLGVARMPSACHAPPTESPATTLLLCDVANPLGHNKEVALEVPLDLSALSLSADGAVAPILDVVLNASSAANGNEAHPDDNTLAATLPLAAVVDLDLVGRTSMEQALLPERASAKAVRFTHTYVVHTVGPTAVEAVSLRVFVPAKARLGGGRGRLVSLLQMQVVVDKVLVACEVSEATKHDLEDGRPSTGRRVADADLEDVEATVQDEAQDRGLRCGADAVVCLKLVCPLRRGASQVDVHLGLLTEALLDVVGAGPRTVAVRTKAVIVTPRVAKLPAGTKVTIARPLQLSTLFIRPSEPADVEPWVVALSVAAGLLLLLLLSLALAKAGFFGRKKVPPGGEVASGEAPGAAGQKAPGAGPADDDTLLAVEDATDAVLVDADVPDTGSDSGMSSTVDAAHTGRKRLSSG